jgi:AcrR family transcriptional regulator
MSTNRERIVESAWQLFWHRGYHITSIADIAENAGVPKGSVYNYFRSKDALLVHCLGRIRYELETHLRIEVLAGTISPAEIVNRLLDFYHGMLAPQDFRGGDPIFSRIAELADTHPGLVAEIQPLADKWIEVVTQKIWAYATVARIPPLVDHAETLSVMIYASLQGLLILAKAERSAGPLIRARKQLVHMVDAYVSAIATGDILHEP